MIGTDVRPGIDAALADPGRLLGRRVGLLANAASLTGAGAPTLEALHDAPGVELAVLFAAEHGFGGLGEDAVGIDDRSDPRTGLEVHSLYGPRRRPDGSVLRELDAVVVDLQEVGVRPYTYAATVALLLEAAADAGTPVVVCDRPNLLGDRVEGPPLDPALRSFLAYLAIPYRHGMTLGELASWYATTVLAGRVDVAVLPVDGWRRDRSPGGAWIPPSPGLPTREATLLYPGLVLLEGTNLSEGRGTSLPFQLLGAPWIDPYALAREINAMPLPGAWARPLEFVPESGRFTGAPCRGVHLHVTDEAALRPLDAAIRILARLHDAYDAFSWRDAAAMPWCDAPDAGRPWHEPCRGPLVDGLAGGEDVRAVIEGRLDVAEARARWDAEARRFLAEARPFLRYEPAPRPAGGA